MKKEYLLCPRCKHQRVQKTTEYYFNRYRCDYCHYEAHSDREYQEGYNQGDNRNY